MKRTQVIVILAATVVAMSVHSCQKETTPQGARVPVLPETVFRYDSIAIDIPFDPFGGHVINNEVATLGRVLFYETHLSVNNRVSCGSCHLQHLAFSDRTAKSKGFMDRLTPRNTPPIVNVGLQEAFFWDLRQPELSDMVLDPIANHIEMGLEPRDYMLEKLRDLSYYPELFAQAFGDEAITEERVSAALEMFMRTLVSVNTRFDIGRNNGFVNFTEEEELGRQLFFFKFPCSACHGGSELSGLSEASNIGLDMDYADNGAMGTHQSGAPLDGWFKVPSLRNIEFTAPYMHDGRFATLEEVVEFYNSGILPHPQLSEMLREHTDGGFFSLGTELGSQSVIDPLGRQPLRMHMTEAEKRALITFMRTMSDRDFIRDERFSDPFVVK
jgi:cytochrome c peroxidase